MVNLEKMSREVLGIVKEYVKEEQQDRSPENFISISETAKKLIVQQIVDEAIIALLEYKKENRLL